MKRAQTRNGFTLIELLIVIVILGLLASLVAPDMLGQADRAKVQAAKTQMKAFETSLKTYRLDMGRYPESLDDLLEGDNPNWQGPYFPEDIPLDPWGFEYVYRTPGDDGEPYSLFSYGADGKAGGEDNDADVIHK